MDFVCTQCGRRQPRAPRCAGCGDDNLLDLAQEQTRDLLVDIDQRRRDRREAHIRIASVGLGMATVVALWFVPGYWDARGVLYPGLPMVADQWLLMIGIAFGLTKLLPLRFGARPRFPFIDGSGNLRPPE